MIDHGEKDSYMHYGDIAAIRNLCMRNHEPSLCWGHLHYFELK